MPGEWANNAERIPASGETCRLSPQERYARDNSFRTLVDLMTMMIERCEFTPTELREAAILAAIRHDQRHGPLVYVLDGRPGFNLSRAAAHCAHCGYYWSMPIYTDAPVQCPHCRAPWESPKR